MDLLEPPSFASHAVAPDGEAFIWRPTHDVVVQRARGVLSIALAGCFAAFYRELLRGDVKVSIFDDFENLTHYTRDARELLTALTQERHAHIAVIHFLLGTKLMALGVGAFQHDVGDTRVRTHADRRSFLKSYEDAVGAESRPP